MSRLFNVEVFNGTINGQSMAPDYFTSPDFNALLGSADVLAVQVFVDSCTAMGKVDLKYMTSNTGVDNTWNMATLGGNAVFVSVNTAPGTASTSERLYIGPDLTINTGSNINSYWFINGAMGRFRLQYSPASGDGTATVRVVACGRTND